MANYVFTTLNSKYMHVCPAPFCVAAHYIAKDKKNGVNDNKYHTPFFTINENLDEVVEKILAYNPHYIGFSTYIWNAKQTYYIVKQIRKKTNNYPNKIYIVLGGPEVAFGNRDAEILLKKHIIDEISKEEYSENPLDAFYADNVSNKIAYIETQKGCPFNCAFCLSGRLSEHKILPEDEAYDNITAIANASPRIIKFVDRTFNINETHAINIINFIKKNSGVKFPSFVKFHFEIAGDIIKPKLFNVFSTLPKGLVQLEIGLQTFNEKSLEAINRKTNTKLLIQNIQKLINMKNMHIHIDLIAGLPYEDIFSFRDSFNKAFELRADTLQLGFLKILHGSPLEKEIIENKNAKNYIKYEKHPPYEIIETKWLSAIEKKLLKLTEDQLERMWNSGRFRNTTEYVLKVGKLCAFDLFTKIGLEFYKKKIGYKVELRDYTKFIFDYLQSIPGVKKIELRDMMVLDILSSQKEGKIPEYLRVNDPMLSKIKNELTFKKGQRCSIAILYTLGKYIVVDYSYNPAKISWDNIK